MLVLLRCWSRLVSRRLGNAMKLDWGDFNFFWLPLGAKIVKCIARVDDLCLTLRNVAHHKKAMQLAIKSKVGRLNNQWKGNPTMNKKAMKRKTKQQHNLYVCFVQHTRLLGQIRVLQFIFCHRFGRIVASMFAPVWRHCWSFFKSQDSMHQLLIFSSFGLTFPLESRGWMLSRT